MRLDQVENGAVHLRPLWLYQIQSKRRLPTPRIVHDAEGRIIAIADRLQLQLGKLHGVGIIQHRIEWVRSAAVVWLDTVRQ